ncbi:trimeric intracellular cation channel family protein [Chitinophaga parva]|uniref:Trimeric intracellular cation channel family protein n=1 Tax=Chitinophaga parva TaxID=2169414 RepID=A0A2T7BCH8_9BACT|nr:trimeric intracellular cation channel family protein [Chitinophaga parva]PUZ22720.1 trimeric intracellular cation channel family protein [Chitinophaga parva]
MNQLHPLYFFIDLAGTFAFAISGAEAARQKGLDIFGIAVLAFAVACGGGIIRDVCIGAIPPAGLSDWHYLVTAIAASIITITLQPLVKLLNRPVIFFDALGLALFAVSGARKTLSMGYNNEVAILLGMITAVGGGILRDIMLARVPVVLEKEVYASAALLGAAVVTFGTWWGWAGDAVFLAGFLSSFALRLLAIQFHWQLPAFKDRKG